MISVSMEDMPSENGNNLSALPEPRRDSEALVHQVRQIVSSSTPLAAVLADPELARSLTNKSTKNSDGSKGRRKGSSMLRHIVAEEERQVHSLRSLLSTVADHLEREIRQGDHMAERTDYAETRAKEFCTRFAAAENAHQASEKELIKCRAEADQCRQHLSGVELELKRTKLEIESFKREREELEASLKRSRGVARDYEQILAEYEAKTSEKDVEQRVELQRWYETGCKHGHSEGYWEGFEQGKAKGFVEGEREGLRRGRQRGRKEERLTALGAFDDFLSGQMHRSDEMIYDVVQRWRASVYASASRGTNLPSVASYGQENSDQRVRRSESSSSSG